MLRGQVIYYFVHYHLVHHQLTNRMLRHLLVNQIKISLLQILFSIHLVWMCKYLIMILIHWQLRYTVIKLNLLKMVSTLFMIVLVTFINNTTYLRLEITLMNFFMRLDKIGELISTLVKTLQILLVNGSYKI